MKIICVYKISSNIKPYKFYIGSAINYHDRKWRHSRELILNKHKNAKLQYHVNKYGINDLVFEIIELLTNNSETIAREQFFIDQLNPWFNIRKTAGSNLGGKHSEKTKQKISAGNKGKTVSEDSRRKISNSRLGFKYSNEQKAQMSKQRRGIKREKFSEEWRNNMRIAQIGHTNNIKGWKTRRVNALKKEAICP